LAAVDAELRLALVCEDGSWSVRNVRSGAVKAAAKLPVGAALNDRLLTFDGAYAWGALGPKRASALDERRQVVDLATGRVRDIASGDSIASSPTAAEIAWTTRGGIVVFHCPTGTSRRIEASGAGGWGLAWSPDGTMLAYTGSTNPFTSQPWFTDLRVVEPRTGRSTTVARRLFTAGAGARLFWVR
jgi:hypothetical protein